MIEKNKGKKKPLYFRLEDKKIISEIIQKDLEFLEKMGLTEYSLLIEIEKVISNLNMNKKRFEGLSRNEYKSSNNSKIYHIGIIDFFQIFDFLKKIECFYKTKIKRVLQFKETIAPPNFYKKGF